MEGDSSFDYSVDDDGEPDAPRLRSQVEGGRVRGRGSLGMDQESRYSGRSGVFERLSGDRDDMEGDQQPARSIEGWIVIVTGVHEEAQEDQVQDKFADFGVIKNIHLPLDRRTGFVKGYALIEYEMKKEAQAAIDRMHGATLLGQTLGVDWAFMSGTSSSTSSRSNNNNSTGGGRRRESGGGRRR
eukprot:TRINITY_DN1350_c0_g1_i3.p1 TRINITY_DN1350_c0_g1~~TRINITY_DN1350_c0_g1_i3.p1  ORF type:complete len:193 (+),score=43.29 TRINITY_DN1350_c0_g1_i3:26-580(+)